jgi:UDP-glucose 4-epimerase
MGSSLKPSQSKRKVLVTGGTGYIGSHACVRLIEAGYQVIVVDNLCNSSAAALQRVAKITGVQPEFVEADIRDDVALRALFARHRPGSVMHFAGLKAVGESVEHPALYEDNNVQGSRCLVQVMAEYDVRRLVFSSSATVYGDAAEVPIPESSPLKATNPYGQTKLDVENLLRDLAKHKPDWQIALLRYFNPVGAHPSGLIGEDPRGIPNNLMPFIAQVAVGRREKLSVFGNDYPTADGTGVRDYIHVMDLVDGHVDTLRYLEAHEGIVTLNLGTGSGVSVLEMVQAFEQVNAVPIPYEFAPRRPGDVAQCWADATLARETLGWKTRLDLRDMCRDSWRWQQGNPQGY